ncbi:mitochondrial import inner membrane translocase subunit TIM50 [Geosmithia morbida]|uniref:Mitochondrial import inner membrane translocase subunit TIM50 n=1 Tax=Geosmithia morbida TaxID=1094350 RepID=A0A9P4YXU0_9HYPO|nr:mitochondrial import inner membrane translocase subunit TIM50 [Geosmithia morbida]KAF4124845.1 mitochondrial import inner membrane translocase subunit TIM50 [Geosmithia morbida]
MLSKFAQATRLGVRAARFVPVTTARPASAIAVSPWIRTYSKGSNKGSDAPSPKQDAPQSKAPEEPSSSEPASDSSKSAADGPKESEPIAFDKLPDLTQGIPSTLEAEMEEIQGRGKPGSALQTVAQEKYERRGRGGSDPYVSTSERNRRWWTRVMLVMAGGGSVMGLAYLGRNWDDDAETKRHPDIPNGLSPSLWWQRVRARTSESVSYYQDPAFDKLLPDPDPSFERPYTLVVSLEDLLVHSEWSRQHGWRLAKRPGVDYFIRYLGQYYELVVWSSTPFALAEGIVRKLDPFRFIMWPLFREATKFEDGEIVKDISYLNRDPSKVIVLDTNAIHARKNPENAIILDPWNGEAGDKELVSLIPFLEYIHTMQYSDVRKVIKSFDGKHIPTEFARREAIARQEFNARIKAEKAKHSKPSGMGALGSMLGLGPSNLSMTVAPDGEQNPNEAFAQGKMLQDIARERGQRNYELMEKEIRENGHKWLEEEKMMNEKLQKEAMENMFGSFGGWFAPKSGEKKN